MRITALPVSLAILATACGARSSLGVGAEDSSADASSPHDAAVEASGEPVFWTFTTPGSAWALALDDDGNPFVAVHHPAQTTTLWKLDGSTKQLIWKVSFENAPVYSMAYAAGSLYLTGVSPSGAHLDFGNLAYDLPAIDGNYASYVAKVDARDGTARWVVSPDVARGNDPAESKCLHIAAGAEGALVSCGYSGTRFGLAPPWLPDRGALALLRLDTAGRPVWSRAFSGDLVMGHPETFRRPVGFDENGDVWLAGMTSLPLVDESSSTPVLAGTATMPRAYVMRVENASQLDTPASSWPLATGNTERQPDVASIAAVGGDVFLAGTLGTAQGYTMCLDARTLATRWQSTFLADSVRTTPDGNEGLFAALASARERAGLAHFDRKGGSVQSTIVTVTCGPCLPFISASELQLDARRHALYFLGVTTGHVRFDDGTEIDSPSSSLVFLAKRPTF